MVTMSRQTGQAITDLDDRIAQSVWDILTTPVGTRLMRREYGSALPFLIDQPLNDATLLRAYSAAVSALIRWEPRLRINRIVKSVSAGTPGNARFSIDGVIGERPFGTTINIGDRT